MTPAPDLPPDLPADLHADAVARLTAYPPGDAAQAAARTEFLGFLAAHPDGVWRSCRPGHLTASALVLDPGGERVLLTLHAKVRRWMQTGGHCEPTDASLAGAALREATEETGVAGLVLDPVPVALDRHPAPCRPGADHLDVQFLAVAPAGAAPQVSAESVDVRWWPVAALPEDTDAGLRRLVRRAVAVRAGQSASSPSASPEALATPSR